MAMSPLTNIKKKSMIFSTFFITLLIISATTAVPQAQGKVVTDQLDEYETYRTLVSTIESLTTIDEETASSTLCLLLLSINEQLIDALTDPDSLQDFDLSTIVEIVQNNEAVSQDILLERTEASLKDLDQTLEQLQLSETLPSEQKLSIPFLQTLISWLLQLLKNKLTGDNGGGLPDGGNGGFFEILMSILSAAMVIPIMILKALANGLVGLINGILKILGSIIVIFLLMLAGMQTTLTLGAFFFIFLGLMSKVGIKAFSIIGAPIFALIAAQFSVSLGSMIGGIAMALFSVLGIIILLALPLSIIGLLFFAGGSNDDDDDGGGGINFNFDFEGTGIIYMLLSLFASMLNGSSE